MNENESAFRIMVNKGDMNTVAKSSTDANRGNRTKSLLSGGFGRPNPMPVSNNFNSLFNNGNNANQNNGNNNNNSMNNNRPNNSTWNTSLNPWQQANGGQFNGGNNHGGNMGNMGNNGNNGNNMMGSALGSSLFGNNGNNVNNNNNSGLFGNANNNNNSLFGNANNGNNSLFGNNNNGLFGNNSGGLFNNSSSTSKPFSWLDTKKKNKKDKKKHKSFKSLFNSSSDSDSDASSSSSSSDSSDSSSDDSNNKKKKKKKERKSIGSSLYGVSDSSDSSNSSSSSDNSDSSDSNSDDSDTYKKKRRKMKQKLKRKLGPIEKRIVLNTIREHCPDSMHDLVYEDIMSQMDELHKKGFKLPKNYDKRKHDLGENEIKLYEQQLQKDKKRDKDKMSYMISFSAMALDGIVKAMSVSWLKTSYLPMIIQDSLKEGEFDDFMEGIGMYLRGTIFDNSLFSTGLKFAEKVADAHHKEMLEEQEKLEEEEEKKDKKIKTKIGSMNQFRGLQAGLAFKEQESKQHRDEVTNSLPKPTTSLIKKNRQEDQKKSP